MLITWLPLPDYSLSIESLSDEHLKFQRFHILEILECLHTVEDSALPVETEYSRHRPTENDRAVAMWKGFEVQLAEYGLQVCEEYAVRTAKADPIYDAIMFHLECALSDDSDMSKPNWFGDVDFHLSHQSELKRLDPGHYTWPNPNEPLIWPESKHGKAS